MRRHFITALLLMTPYAGMAMAQDTTQAQRTPQDSSAMRQSQPYDNNAMGPQSDEAILMRLHRTNQMEIRAGRLAQRNGTAKVKSFGARLVRDHSAADKKVTALAKQLGITLARGQFDSTDNKYGRDHDRMDRPDYRQRTDSSQRSDSTNREGVMPRGDTTQDNQSNRYGQDSTRNHGYGDRGYQDQDSTHRDMMRNLGMLRGAAFDTAFANAMVNGHQKAIDMLEQVQGQVQHDQLRTFIASTLPTLRQHLQIAQSLGGTATTTTTTSSRE